MTQEQSAALMTDLAFRGRVKVCCLKYADYIMLEPQATTAHVSRMKWASQTVASPDVMAMNVQPPTVMDSAVQADGSNITDDALQASVQVTVDKWWI